MRRKDINVLGLRMDLLNLSQCLGLWVLSCYPLCQAHLEITSEVQLSFQTNTPVKKHDFDLSD